MQAAYPQTHTYPFIHTHRALALQASQAAAAGGSSSSSVRMGAWQQGSSSISSSDRALPLAALHGRSRVRGFSSLPPHQVVGLPALSPTMEHGTIASWAKKEGESFGPGDVLCEVETDKAVVSFDAQDEGVVAKILVQAGSGEVKVGQPILIVVEDADQVGAFANYTPDASAAAAAPAAAKPAAPSPPSPPPPPTPAAAPTPPPAAAGAALLSHPARVPASPLAKTLASQLGYDLRAIPGTGPNGRVIAADVREFVPPVQAAAPAHAQPPAAAIAAPMAAGMAAAAPALPPIPGVGHTDYPLSEASKAIAARLTVAKQTVPHYYLTVDLNLTQLLEVRAKLNKEVAGGGKGGGEEDGAGGLSVNDFLLKAAALASKKVPEANASWHGDFVRQYHGVDINVPIGVGDGLVAPVVRGVEGKGLKALSAEVRALEQGAAAGALDAAALQPGTFTLVNVGMYGVKSVAPIVSLPQACMLGVGAIENRVVPAAAKPKDGEEGEVYDVAPCVTVTLACDHRVIDGAVGAQWLSAFKALVEDPVTLLL